MSVTVLSRTDDLPDEPIQMVTAGEQVTNAVLRRFADVRQGVVCVYRELPLHVIEKQPLAQVLALEQFGVRAVQPSGDLGECGLVEPSFAGYGWVLARLRTPAQDGVELDI